MKRFIKSSYFALIMLFIYVPIFVMMVFSFNDSTSLLTWHGFTLDWYTELLINNTPMIRSIVTSIFIATTSTIISLFIGVMACTGLTRIKQKTRNRWVRIANIPIVNAEVITAIGLMIFFVLAGIRFGTITLLAAHISFNVPYVIITVLPFMMRVDKNIIQASKDLGATPHQTFFKVVFPLLIPSIITAAGICFAMSFDDFIISYFTGGPQTNISTFIYTQRRLQPFINAFGTLLVSVIVLLFIIWNGVKITRQHIEETKIKIKKGEYKIKQIAKINAEIAYLTNSLITNTIIVKSHNLIKLIKYKILQSKVKRLENKNTDIKISKLQWKQELIKNEIKREEKYFLVFKKLNEKKKQFEEKIASSTNAKKNKKNIQIIDKLNKRIVKYEAEIAWINNRNEVDKNRISEMENQIRELQTEIQQNQNLTQKEELKYKKLITKLNIDKTNLAKGRNQARLQNIILKLEDYKKNIATKLVNNYKQLQEAKAKIFQTVSFTYKLDKKILKLSSKNRTLKEILTNKKQVQFENMKSDIENKMKKNQAKLEKIYEDINNKKAKFFPISSDGKDDISKIKNKGWITRNWKKIGLATLLTSSFALITTAYMLISTFDLVVGNWGNYIDISLINEFEREFGVRINYQQYDSNESLYNRNLIFNYDIMIPSDYMIRRLAQEGFLNQIDWEMLNREIEGHETMKITPYGEFNEPTFNEDGVPSNLNISPNLTEKLQQIKVEIPDEGTYDLTYFSLPWFHGDVRIVFNKENQALISWLNQRNLILDENAIEGIDVHNLSWSILWEAAEAGFVLALNNDPRNVFMYAFQKLFGNVQISSSVNARAEIDAAAEALSTLLTRNNVGIYGDDLISIAAERQFDIAVMYNGDIVYSLGDYYEPEPFSINSQQRISTNPNVFVAIPYAEVADQENIPVEDRRRESTNIWADQIAISSNSRNLELTYKFINFMFRWESQWRNVDAVAYTPGFVEVLDVIFEEDYFGTYLTPMLEVTTNGELFDLNITWDDYLVNRFNEILALMF